MDEQNLTKLPVHHVSLLGTHYTWVSKFEREIYLPKWVKTPCQPLHVVARMSNIQHQTHLRRFNINKNSSGNELLKLGNIMEQS